MLGEAAQSLTGGVELRKPEARLTAEPSSRESLLSLIAKLGADAEAVAHFDSVLLDWSAQTQRLVEDSDGAREEVEGAGPGSELSFWRDRMAKLNSVLEQLKGREARLVLEACTAARSPALATWRVAEGRCVSLSLPLAAPSYPARTA